MNKPRAPRPASEKKKSNNKITQIALNRKASHEYFLEEKLEAGVVWCNTYNQFDAASPFGGYKESGFGREGGRQGLLEYLDFGGAR